MMLEVTDPKAKIAPSPSCSTLDDGADVNLGSQLFRDSELQSACDHFQSKHSGTSDALLGFNAFSLVSDTFYRENFHSDVLAAFFDMRGPHGEQILFLHGFIELIRSCCSPQLAAAISTRDFLNYETRREKGRIDIVVLDNDSRKAIIVENKINNAGDQPRQIPEYVKKTESQKFNVVAIVYLSLDGRKHPSKNDWSEKEKKSLEPRLIQMAAFTDGRKPDLLTHWVHPSLQVITSADALIILRQYGRLLHHLGAQEMDYTIMKQFHDWLLKDGNREKAFTMRRMLGEIPVYLQKMIMERYQAPHCAPFDHVFAWGGYTTPYAVFEGFKYRKGSLALNIVCSETRFEVWLLDRNAASRLSGACLLRY